VPEKLHVIGHSGQQLERVGGLLHSHVTLSGYAEGLSAGQWRTQERADGLTARTNSLPLSGVGSQVGHRYVVVLAARYLLLLYAVDYRSI
jgi:hypothetical protein